MVVVEGKLIGNLKKEANFTETDVPDLRYYTIGQSNNL